MILAAVLAWASIGAASADPVEREYEAICHLRRDGKPKEAAERFEALAADHPTHPYATRALEAAGAICMWQLDEVDRARLLFDRAIEGPEDRPGVLPALIQRLQIERDRGGPKAELTLIERHDRARPSSEHAPYLLLRAASILADDLGDLEGALRPLERIRRAFGHSARAPKALMKEAEVLRKLGRPERALALYRAIIDTQEASFIVGEYNATVLDDAYYQVGETYRLDLRDPKRALEAYEALVDKVPLSRLVDDALHRAEQVAAQEGDLVRALAYHRRLVRLRPYSRYAPRKIEP